MPILNFRAEGVTEKGDVRPAPELMAHLGPVVQVTIHVPEEVAQAYADRGETSPPPINGYAIIDTGATMTCFDAEAAQAAGLPTIGDADMSSASHMSSRVPVFAGKIFVPGLGIGINIAEGMGANLSSINLKNSDGEALVALLGRDFLRNTVLVYNGSDGHFSLST